MTTIAPVSYRAARYRLGGSSSLAVIARQLLHATVIGALVTAPLRAQVTPTGPHAPSLDVAGNGTPVVRIATPNGAGVSHNTFTDFNVDGRGLILNNSSEVTATKLAGYIDGNANLKRSGAANLILSEVVGGNPSNLSGYVEVAGPAAQVVIANANGIACNGCGFINSPWATLTTGKAVFGPAGGVTGYAVDGGTLSIDGKGLDASGMRLDLFARAVHVNAGIWADRINATAGAGDIAVAGSDAPIVVTARKATEANAPVFALDVAAVGGMYARSIRLIGTEVGLGVRVDGTLASLENGFSLSSEGNIVLGGKAVATTDATLRAAGAATVSGTVYGAHDTAIATGGALVNTGLIASGRDLAASATSVASSGTLAAGLKQDGSLAASGALTIASPGLVQLSGQTVAPGIMTLIAGSIDLANGAAQAARAALSADTIAQARDGQLRVTGDLALRSGAIGNAGTLQGGDVTLAGTSLANTGSLIATKALTLAATGGVSNSGTIQSNAAMRVTADRIDNSGGTIVNLSTADTAVVTRDTLINRLGTLGGNGAVGIDVGALDTGGMSAARRAQLVAGAALTVTARNGDITADGGRISAGGTLGLFTAQRAITARAGGEIVSGGDATLSSETIDLSGGTLWIGNLALQATRLLTVGGALRSSGSGSATINVGTLDNSGGGLIHADGQNLSLTVGSIANVGGRIEHAGGGALAIAATDAIANSGGGIATNGALRLDALTLNNASGVLSAQQSTALTVTGALANYSGAVTAGGPLDILAGEIANQAGGTILALGSGALSIDSRGAIDSRGGTIGGLGNVSVSASAIDVSGVGAVAKPGQAGNNGQLSASGSLIAIATRGLIRADQGGLIAAGKDASLSASDTIQAMAGTIAVTGTAGLHARAINLDGGTLTAGSFALGADSIALRGTRLIQTGTSDLTVTTSGTLDYSGADFTTNSRNFSLSAGQIVNVGGAMRHAGSGVFSLTARTLDNRNGLLATAGTLAVDVATLGNQGGRLSAAGDVAINASTELDNSAGGLTDATGGAITGNIIAGQALRLTGGAINNTGGTIEAAGSVAATIASLAGTGGQIKSTGTSGTMSLVASGAIIARGGVIGSNGATTVRGGSIDIGGAGTVSAGTTLDIGTAGTLRADAGSIRAAAVTLAAPTLVLDGGSLTGDTLNFSVGALSNAGGTISATGTGASRISVVGSLVNTGKIQANSTDLAISAGRCATAVKAFAITVVGR